MQEEPSTKTLAQVFISLLFKRSVIVLRGQRGGTYFVWLTFDFWTENDALLVKP